MTTEERQAIGESVIIKSAPLDANTVRLVTSSNQTREDIDLAAEKIAYVINTLIVENS